MAQSSPTSKQLAREVVHQRLSKIQSEKFIKLSKQIEINLSATLQTLTLPPTSAILTFSSIQRYHEPLISVPSNYSFVDTLPPGPGTEFPDKKFDLIIIPLYGFNKLGYRLGHGGGWYDRFLLTQSQAITIGVGYESCLVDFKVRPHDIPLSYVITEEKIRDFTCSQFSS